ncbi:unnamed protein product [Adineta steineri]|uniref:Nuclear receptor domain-containing protein n=1 Tax=Adineta steineri TaxID=433720 RepID=A0A816BQU7_9BILA|nr:unnamed protein product [Adineta steineri]CAF1398324.1 unnamed protein product [Adineta steineri]CAF1505594.1 unnamed protein product [Adineta steineri]CAF1613307.1 unnamed protein product [Adineta steineri]
MPLKRPLSTSSPLLSTHPTESSLCRVCDDSARIINYGTLSCQSCKTFFRRNGFHPKNIRLCLLNGSCEIDINTRRNCTACRFAKCLLMGMSPDLIRKEVQERKKHLQTRDTHTNQVIAVQQLKLTTPLPTLDLLYDDRSPLNNSEWTLLSNVTHAHDTFSAIPQIRHAIYHLSASLSSSLDTSYNVTDVFETITLMYTSMQSFISSSSDFRILTINEQSSLYQRNLHGIVALCSILFLQATQIIDNPICVKTFSIIYGSEMMIQAIRMCKKLDTDVIIIKLMLLILAFSSNCFIINQQEDTQNDSFLNGTYRLLGSQNVYVQLLWKYMTYRYGYYHAARRFFRLIEIVLDLIKYSGAVYTYNDTHHGLVDNILGQAKQSLIVDYDKQKPLWGKP